MTTKHAFYRLMIGITLIATPATPLDKDDLLSKYRDKFVIVMNEGLSTGFCPSNQGQVPTRFSHKIVINIHAVNDVETSNPYGCNVEAARKGEVLKVFNVGFHSGSLVLLVRTASPHSITRGIGAFAHQDLEQGATALWIKAGTSGKSFDEADTLAGHWFKAFDTVTDAAAFGNTSTGVFVNQVKGGMSFSDVERALGVPQTRVDLGEKVLYKYKDMTIEFHDGKVTDVH